MNKSPRLSDQQTFEPRRLRSDMSIIRWRQVWTFSTVCKTIYSRLIVVKPAAGLVRFGLPQARLASTNRHYPIANRVIVGSSSLLLPLISKPESSTTYLKTLYIHQSTNILRWKCVKTNIHLLYFRWIPVQLHHWDFRIFLSFSLIVKHIDK